MKVISLAVDSKPEEHHIISLFLTDTLSVLQALTNNKLTHLTKALQLLSNNRRVALQWIPAQCGVPGNEQADKLAKEGATVNYQTEKATITKAIMMPSQEKDAYHLLSMSEQVVMVRLRTEHNHLNAHMHKQLNMVL